MDKYSQLCNKLYNDILMSFYPDTYLLNQEGEINSFNTLEKKSKTKTVDGGNIIKRTTDYVGNLSYDSFNLELIRPRYLTLSFCSNSDHSGIDFLNYINSVLRADPRIFVRTKGLLIQDVRKYLLKARNICINDTKIDNNLIANISKYFKDLETVSFRNCVIKKQCNFNTILCNVNLDESEIENIQSFAAFQGNLEMIRTNIQRISPVNIYSEKLKIDCIDKVDNTKLKELFLKCNFPNLKNFTISPEVTYTNYSFEDSFTYLPDSAPKLESLIVEGKIRSLDFLLKFKHLLSGSVLSIYDEYGLFNPYVTDGKERKKIQERNRLQIEIQKILQSNLDEKFIDSTVEFNRILKLIKINQLLSYEEKEKEFLLSNLEIIKYYINNIGDDKSIDYYYKRYFDSLELKQTDSDMLCLLREGHKIKILNNILYFDNMSGLDSLRNNKNIVLTKDFIYYIDGKPIIFDAENDRRHPIRTIEEARKKVANRKVDSFDCEEYNYNKFLECLNDLKSFDSSVTVGDFQDLLHEQYNCDLDMIAEFKKLGNTGRQISYIFERFERLLSRGKSLEKKKSSYQEALAKLILDNYEKFSILEKKYIYNDRLKYDDMAHYIIDFLEEKKLIDQKNGDSLADKINNKTNGLYKKYTNRLRLIDFQDSVLGSPYEEKIDKKLIKRVNIDRKI